MPPVEFVILGLVVALLGAVFAIIVLGPDITVD